MTADRSPARPDDGIREAFRDLGACSPDPRSPAPEWAHKIAERIAADVRNRRGLGNEWDNIEADIQDEIVEEWASLIAADVPGSSDA